MKSSACSQLWFKLLRHQRNKGLTGFTPSFLIGAGLLPTEVILTEIAAFDQLVSILSSFANESEDGYHVVVARCTKHGQPIASLYPTAVEKPDCDVVVDYNEDSSSLYAEGRYFSTNDRTIDSLSCGLWTFFEQPLLNREYSFRNNVFCEFNDSERQLVLAIQK